MSGAGRRVARAFSVAAALLAAGCAGLSNTPAQDLAWERWKQCDKFPTITLKDIKPNGEIWIWTQYGADLAAYRDCARAALAEQIRAGRLTAPSTPPVTAHDAKLLVKFAYFTDQPPSEGTFLHTTFGRNMPPEVKIFGEGSRVTFFYALNQAGRVLKTTSNWIGPDGRVAKTVDQTVSQMRRPGQWTWRTQHAQAELSAPGRWVVELLIDGHPVGSYEFVVRTSRAH